jgi:hypothetical protein
MPGVAQQRKKSMSFLQWLLHRCRDGLFHPVYVFAREAHIDASAEEIKFQIDKCPVPIIWLDTSVLLNLAKLRLGMLKDKTQENRLTRLRQHIYDLTREGKLLCPKAGQADEVWAKRPDFLKELHELSLGITTRSKAAIEQAQIFRLMRAYIAGTRSVTFSYVDAFIDDPVPGLEQMLTKDYFVTVDSGLIGAVHQIQSQRDTIHQELEKLRKKCTGEAITFEQQLQKERIGGINATISMAQDFQVKTENGKEPTENERGAFLVIERLIHTWDRLRGKPKGSKGLQRFLESPYYQIAPSCDISSLLIAKLMVGARKICHGDAMDVDHLSSMLPYANLMIVDRSMKSFVRGMGLDKKYRTMVCYVGDDEEISDFFDNIEKD